MQKCIWLFCMMASAAALQLAADSFCCCITHDSWQEKQNVGRSQAELVPFFEGTFADLPVCWAKTFQ